MHAFLVGFLLALGLILPLGVQNTFVFNQGANQPTFLKACPSFLTAAFCDMVLILSAVLGVSVVVWTLPWVRNSLSIVGFFFLIYMAWVTWRSNPSVVSSENELFSAKKQVLFALSVSLLNPHALMDTMGVIGLYSLQFTGKDKLIFTVACILVSVCWFILLSAAGRLLRVCDQTGRGILIVNRLSALIMLSIAGYLARQVIFLSFS